MMVVMVLLSVSFATGAIITFGFSVVAAISFSIETRKFESMIGISVDFG